MTQKSKEAGNVRMGQLHVCPTASLNVYFLEYVFKLKAFQLLLSSKIEAGADTLNMRNLVPVLCWWQCQDKERGTDGKKKGERTSVKKTQ